MECDTKYYEHAQAIVYIGDNSGDPVYVWRHVISENALWNMFETSLQKVHFVFATLANISA